MTMTKIINLPEYMLHNASKGELIAIILSLRETLRQQQAESEIKLLSLQEKLERQETELNKLTRDNINKTVNQPSSKQPEFNKSTGAGKKKTTRKKHHRGRKGAGNRPKPTPDITHTNPLTCCLN